MNISWLWVSRVAKILALLLFFTPWMVVSCNNTTLVEASGYQMAMGNPTVADMPMSQVANQGDGMDPVWWVIVAAVVILAGVAVSFVAKGPRAGGRVLLVSSVLALALLGGGMAHMVSKMKSEMSKAMDDKDMDEMTRSMALMMGNAIKIETLGGFWMTLGLLGLGGVSAALTQVGGARPRPASERVANTQGGA